MTGAQSPAARTTSLYTANLFRFAAIVMVSLSGSQGPDPAQFSSSRVALYKPVGCPHCRHIGFIGLHQVHWRFRAATGGLVIGERAAWGRGHATDAVRVRTRFAFEELGLHRIEGHTLNPAMRRVYEKCGYRHEGVARQKYSRGGRWHDADLFGILDSDYFDGIAAEAESQLTST